MIRRLRGGIAWAIVLGLAALAPACKKKDEPPPRVGLTPVEHGKELYGRICAVCHGASGEGYKADEATSLAQPDFLASVTDAYLKAAIVDGRQGSTMSAWSVARGGPLTPADVDAVIAYMRTWDRKPHVPGDDSPTLGDPARGLEVYTRECVKCHGERGTGGPHVRLGNPGLLVTASNGFLRRAIKDGRAGTPMPAFAHLGNDRVEDLLALLRTWESPASPAPTLPSRPPPLPLGPVPLNPRGPEPVGFKAEPEHTGIDLLKAALDRGARVAILDARAPSDYIENHITGAVSVPFYDVKSYVAKLPRNAWIVCYCMCPHAESGQLAKELVQEGFKKVTVLDEGLRGWLAKGYPVKKGEKP